MAGRSRRAKIRWGCRESRGGDMDESCFRMRTRPKEVSGIGRGK